MRAPAIVVALSVVLLGPQLAAQTRADTAAIRGVIQDEITAWDHGDATAYSRHVAANATFTNIRGQFFTGRAAFSNSTNRSLQVSSSIRRCSRTSSRSGFQVLMSRSSKCSRRSAG